MRWVNYMYYIVLLSQRKKKLEKSHFVLGQVFRGTNLNISIYGELLLYKHGNKITQDFKSLHAIREGIYLSCSHCEQLKSGKFVFEKRWSSGPTVAVQPIGLSSPFLSSYCVSFFPFLEGKTHDHNFLPRNTETQPSQLPHQSHSGLSLQSMLSW